MARLETGPMGTHSEAEAKDRLFDLIDRAMTGEDVVITRHGRPVVELRAVPTSARPVSRADLDWLAERRAALASELRPGHEDAVTLVSRMRDEDEERLVTPTR